MLKVSAYNLIAYAVLLLVQFEAENPSYFPSELKEELGDFLSLLETADFKEREEFLYQLERELLEGVYFKSKKCLSINGLKNILKSYCSSEYAVERVVLTAELAKEKLYEKGSLNCLRGRSPIFRGLLR